MLTVVLKMKSKPGVFGAGLVAKEIAPDIADAVYEPSAGEHVPGVANKAADVLSRRFEPKYAATWQVLEVLKGVSSCNVPVRNDSYYRTLRPPSTSFPLWATSPSASGSGC